MFGAVIFDWDGTLADTKAPILKSFHHALHEVLNLDVADEFITRRIGVGAEWTFREILQAKGLPVDEAVLARLVDVKIRTAIEAAGDVKLFAGARQLLGSLNGKKPLALASMNNRAVIDHLVTVLDVAKFFKVVVTVDDVTKPSLIRKSSSKPLNN
jgi:beta-phosphoglucomutase-like phosphatase (HAD superfamily)